MEKERGGKEKKEVVENFESDNKIQLYRFFRIYSQKESYGGGGRDKQRTREERIREKDTCVHRCLTLKDNQPARTPEINPFTTSRWVLTVKQTSLNSYSGVRNFFFMML